MDEAARVLARLMRIEGMLGSVRGSVGQGSAAQGGAAQGRAPELLAELRALVPEAEAWARAEGDARARTAATKLREGAEVTGGARARTAATKLREEAEGMD